MPTDYEIRDRIAAYLLGELTLDEFQHWLIPRAWEASPGNADLREPNALELLGDLELRLAEYTNGHLDESELQEALRTALKTHRVETASQRTGSAASMTTVPIAFKPFAVAGTRS
jgi:hypothetical protein